MSKHLNRVQIIGNLGKDPEIRRNQTDTRIASFTVATSESWTDKATGERREYTQWHRVSVLVDGLSGVVEKYLRKGQKVFVEGQLETRKWTGDDGKDNYVTEVVVRANRGQIILIDNSHAQVAPSPAPADYNAALDDDIPY